VADGEDVLQRTHVELAAPELLDDAEPVRVREDAEQLGELAADD
jgi:hypothetical protein